MGYYSYLKQEAREAEAEKQVPKRYAEGGSVKNLKAAAQELKQMGRGGDTDLVHVNQHEKDILKMMGGSGDINPKTGLREYPPKKIEMNQEEYPAVHPHYVVPEKCHIQEQNTSSCLPRTEYNRLISSTNKKDKEELEAFEGNPMLEDDFYNGLSNIAEHNRQEELMGELKARKGTSAYNLYNTGSRQGDFEGYHFNKPPINSKEDEEEYEKEQKILQKGIFRDTMLLAKQNRLPVTLSVKAPKETKEAKSIEHAILAGDYSPIKQDRPYAIYHQLDPLRGLRERIAISPTSNNHYAEDLYRERKVQLEKKKGTQKKKSTAVHEIVPIRTTEDIYAGWFRRPVDEYRNKIDILKKRYV